MHQTCNSPKNSPTIRSRKQQIQDIQSQIEVLREEREVYQTKLTDLNTFKYQYDQTTYQELKINFESQIDKITKNIKKLRFQKEELKFNK